MKILAAVARKPNEDFSFETLNIAAPGPEEVLVKIKGVGLCHTDITSKDAPIPPNLPAVLGHEGAGVVVTVGSQVKDIQPGDHVILSFAHCGHCAACEEQEPAYCQQFLLLNQMGYRADKSTVLSDDQGAVASHFFGQSSFASHAITYASNCVKVSTDLPIELMGPLACGVQTGAGTVFNALSLTEKSSVLIYGGGTVGLSAVMAAVVIGCETIVVVDPLAERREMALALGATEVLNPVEEDTPAALKSIKKRGFSAVIDNTARADVIESALDHLAARGTLVLLGLPADPFAAMKVTINSVLLNGQKIIGVIEGNSSPREFIPYLIDLYQQGKFPFDRLITTYAFTELNQAVADQKSGKCVKPVLLLND